MSAPAARTLSPPDDRKPGNPRPPRRCRSPARDRRCRTLRTCTHRAPPAGRGYRTSLRQSRRHDNGPGACHCNAVSLSPWRLGRPPSARRARPRRRVRGRSPDTAPRPRAGATRRPAGRHAAAHSPREPHTSKSRCSDTREPRALRPPMRDDRDRARRPFTRRPAVEPGNTRPTALAWSSRPRGARRPPFRLPRAKRARRSCSGARATRPRPPLPDEVAV